MTVKGIAAQNFAWDNDKAAKLARPSVTFEMAREEGRLLFVGYTMHGEKIRIITARKAEPYERRRYHEENREA
jgi:uncharacterized DUF497 family protein